MHYSEKYNSLLGEVVAEFGLLEWNVIYLVSLYEKDFVSKAEKNKLNAGQIAKKLRSVAKGATRHQNVLVCLLDSFEAAIKKRNDVLHGNPCTDQSGQQRLTRRGEVLSEAALEERITAFRELSKNFADTMSELRLAQQTTH